MRGTIIRKTVSNYDLEALAAGPFQRILQLTNGMRDALRSGDHDLAKKLLDQAKDSYNTGRKPELAISRRIEKELARAEGQFSNIAGQSATSAAGPGLLTGGTPPRGLLPQSTTSSGGAGAIERLTGPGALETVPPTPTAYQVFPEGAPTASPRALPAGQETRLLGAGPSAAELPPGPGATTNAPGSRKGIWSIIPFIVAFSATSNLLALIERKYSSISSNNRKAGGSLDNAIRSSNKLTPDEKRRMVSPSGFIGDQGSVILTLQSLAQCKDKITSLESELRDVAGGRGSVQSVAGKVDELYGILKRYENARNAWHSHMTIEEFSRICNREASAVARIAGVSSFADAKNFAAEAERELMPLVEAADREIVPRIHAIIDAFKSLGSAPSPRPRPRPRSTPSPKPAPKPAPKPVEPEEVEAKSEPEEDAATKAMYDKYIKDIEDVIHRAQRLTSAHMSSRDRIRGQSKTEEYDVYQGELNSLESVATRADRLRVKLLNRELSPESLSRVGNTISTLNSNLTAAKRRVQQYTDVDLDSARITTEASKVYSTIKLAHRLKYKY